MCNDGWVSKHNVVQANHGVSFSLQKEGNSDRCYNVDELWGHYAKENKPVTKDKYFMIPLVWGTKSSQIQIQKSVARRWWGGEMGS